MRLANEAELKHVWKYWRVYEDGHCNKIRNSYIDGSCWNESLLCEWTVIFMGK
jgi:hypothetical protein